MAGTLKEKLLSRRVYENLQGLDCPLVEGLHLREEDSMRDLLCTPSLHRTDILKWICISICPSLNKKFYSLRSTQTDAVIQEMVQFGYEMMLCKPDDLDLIMGMTSPLRQLQFMEQLLTLVPSLQAEGSGGGCSSSGAEMCVADMLVRNEELFGELLSPPHLDQLNQLLSPTCNPWTADLRELLRRETAQCRLGHHRSVRGKPSEDHVGEMTDLLNSTQTILEELHKEADAHSVGSPLSPAALRVAISDLCQLMSAFSQVFNTDFRGYCHRKPPPLSPNTCIFQGVHQLLQTCNQELQAFQQLSATSVAVAETVRQIQTDRRYWGNGEKHTLPERLQDLKKKYTEFLSLYQK